jgi:hypothetical protein
MNSIVSKINSMFGKENKKVPKDLEETRKFLSKIPFIGRGGCGIAALAMYDVATEIGLSPKIVYGYYDEGDINHTNNENYKRIKSEDSDASEYAWSAPHVMLEIDGKKIDCEREYTVSEISRLWFIDFLDQTITRDHLVDSIRNTKAWNPSFDREEYIPKIEEHLGFKLGIETE